MLRMNEIIGHEGIREYFKQAVLKGNVSHAYILSGEEGMGKKTLAEAFSLSLLCENKDGDSCGQCHGCKQVLSRNHPDLIYVTHEKPASIGVDDIRRQLNDTIQVKPYNGGYKVYIVDEAEKMTVQAQNALLKTIEEPPAYAVLLFLTVNEKSFLPTILSRCVQLKLKPLRDHVVRDYLVEKLEVPRAKAEIYSAFARGNLGKAIGLADSQEFRKMYEETLHFLKGLRDMDISQLLNYIRSLKDENVNIQDYLDFMRIWYRDVLMYKTTKDINLLIFKEEFSTINTMCTLSSYEGIQRILTAIDKAKIRMDANVNMELAMELMLLTIKENGT